MGAEVHCVEAGAPLPPILPGDLVLIRGTSWVSAIVRLVQVCHPWRRNALRYRHWSHVALVVSRSGRIVEVVRGGVMLQDADKYRRFERRVIRLSLGEEARRRVAATAHRALRESQGLRGYAAYTIAMATSGAIFGAEGVQQNCAALIAQLLGVAGETVPVRADLMPADFARHYEVR